MPESNDSGFFQNVAPYVTALLNTGANWISGNAGTSKQYHANKKLANLQHKHNMELMEYQLAYNTPAEQMKRFKLAGLNPNLVYGQGTPGNMESAPRYPDIQAPDYQRMYQQTFGDLGSKLQEAKLMAAQTDLVNVKADESGVKQNLMASQKALVEANPYLQDSYINAMISNLQSTAALKKQEADFMVNPHGYTGLTTPGTQKMQLEIENLVQRFNLGQSDLQVKANIIQSQEFKNAILEVQKKWLTDQEITSQHVYQGIMLLLQKMM